jgi:hypothetical protein
MAKMRVTVEFVVSGPDNEEAADTIDRALDVGAIQDAIEDQRETEGYDFTIESSAVIDSQPIVARRRRS